MHRPWLARLAAAGISTIAVPAAVPAQIQWRPLPASTTPAGRIEAAAVYDFARARTVVFGGLLSDQTVDDSTNLWDGAQWTVLAPAIRPAARKGHCMAYDLVRERVVLFGGTNGINDFSDTWEFDGSLWLQHTPPNHPSARAYSAMVFDINSQGLLFGGGTPFGFNRRAANDTWIWDGHLWQQVATPTPPAARYRHALTFDLVRGRTVMFGGSTGATSINDTWEWDGQQWIQSFPPVSPPPRMNHGLTYDLNRSSSILVGGNAAFLPHADQWTWDGTTWTNSTPADLPPPRASHCLVYDWGRGRTAMMFGGIAGAQYLDEVFELDGAHWRARGAAGPTARMSHAAAFDTTANRGVLFGGIASVLGAAPYQDTWVWDDGVWSQATPATLPPARSGHGIAYDSTRQRAVMFGGIANGVLLDDTWEWDGSDWTLQLLQSHPLPRQDVAMAFDEARRETVLFGGRVLGPQPFHSETWVYDGNWHQRAPGQSPPPLANSALAYDSRNRTVLLFGGTNSQPMQNDTWEWNGTTWTLLPTQQSPPPPRSHGLMVDDRARGRLVLFGGSLASGQASDAWDWDGFGWTLVNASPPPPPRAGMAGFFDTLRNQIVVHGGFDGGFLGDTWLFGASIPAEARPYGTACGGVLGSPALAAVGSDRPWLNGTFTVAVEPVPASAPWLLAVGFSRTAMAGVPLPLNLTALGLPNCLLHTSVDQWSVAGSIGTRGSQSLAVPSSPTLLGLAFYCQAAAADPVANPAGMVLSNALACRIGAR